MVRKNNKNSAKQASISGHPAFAAVVALWFAALLGFGSLVLPIALIEKLVSGTGISSVISAAAPPLGFTARIAIAAVAATIGAIVGLLIARKVVNSQNEQQARDFVASNAADDDDTDGAAMRPISAHEELGEDGFDEPFDSAEENAQTKPVSSSANGSTAYNGKRRALSVTDDSGPSEFLDLAPLPGGDVVFDEIAEDEPLELAELAGEGAGDTQQTEAIEDAPAAPFNVDFAGADLDDSDEFRAPQTDPFAGAHAGAGTAPDFAAPSQPFNNHPVEESASFNAPADKLRKELASMNNDSTPDFGVPPVQAPQPFANPEPQYAEPAAQVPTMPHSPPMPPVTDRALNDLGVAELVERFAAALQAKSQVDESPRHAAMAEPPSQMFVPEQAPEQSDPAPFAAPTAGPTSGPAHSPVPSPAPAPAPQPSVAAESEPATAIPAAAMVFRRSGASENAAAPAAPSQMPSPAPMPEPFNEPAQNRALPSALQPLGIEDDDDDFEEEAPFNNLSLSLTKKDPPFAAPTPSPVQPAAPEASPVPAPFGAPVPEAAHAESEDSFSSLLSMKNAYSAPQEFVRIEDDDSSEDGAEQVVVFPGQGQTAANPAPPPSEARPFDGPAAAQPAPRAAHDFSTNSNAAETERALREALEKLQRMSGAA